MSRIRTALFAPASSPRMMEKALGLQADAVILDLEDAVSPEKKAAARDFAVEALRAKTASQRWIRINPVGTGLQIDDLAQLLPQRPDAILVPKADAAGIEIIGRQLEEFESAGGDVPPLVALIETCRGLIEVAEVARHHRMAGLFLGAEDLTAELGVPRTVAGDEILLARQQLAVAARAFNLFAIDTPNLEIDDESALRKDIAVARRVGMTGKACIHPNQVAVVDQGFLPTYEEIEWAQRVVLALENSFAEGRGACALDGKMIDAPVASRAQRILASATNTSPS